jgi:hypothetical protein
MPINNCTIHMTRWNMPHFATFRQKLNRFQIPYVTGAITLTGNASLSTPQATMPSEQDHSDPPQKST